VAPLFLGPATRVSALPPKKVLMLTPAQRRRTMTARHVSGLPLLSRLGVGFPRLGLGAATCNPGDTLQADGTCITAAGSTYTPGDPSSIKLAPITITGGCPPGSTQNADGTCTDALGNVSSGALDNTPINNVTNMLASMFDGSTNIMGVPPGWLLLGVVGVAAYAVWSKGGKYGTPKRRGKAKAKAGKRKSARRGRKATSKRRAGARRRGKKAKSKRRRNPYATMLRTMRGVTVHKKKKHKKRRRNPFVPNRPLTIRDTELHTWFERDRAHVELRNKRTQKTIVEWWDEDVAEAIEDGFLDRRHLHDSAFDYAIDHGFIKGAPARRHNPKRRDLVRSFYVVRVSRRHGMAPHTVASSFPAWNDDTAAKHRAERHAKKLQESGRYTSVEVRKIKVRGRRSIAKYMVGAD